MVPLGKLVMATLFLFAMLPGPANADPKEQFNKGVELAEQGDFSGAVSVFVGVMDKLPSAERGRAHKALGFCYRKLGRLPEAWHHLTSYMAAGNKSDETAARWLSEVSSELSATHKLVQFKCAESDAWFSAGGEGRYPCPGSWWFKPGKYEVEAGAGSKSVMVSVEVKGSSGESGPVVLVEFPPELPLGSGGKGPLVDQKPSGNAWPWVTVGTGAGMMVVGGILHLVGYDRNESLRDKYSNPVTYPDGVLAQELFDDAYSNEVKPLITSTYVLYGVGGATVVAGLVWMLLDDPAEQSASAFQLVPMFGPGEAGAQIQVGF